MRIAVVFATYTLFFCGALDAQNIRNIDFKNFSYTWNGSPSWSDHMEWQSNLERHRIRLTKGKKSFNDAQAERGAGSRLPFEGLTLEEVSFGDVTGDGKEEAIVVIRYDSGGTQYSNFVYIHEMRAGTPKLLAWFHAGDRAYSGLYRVYAQDGKLVVELFDPEKQTGDCCSDGFIRTRYLWRRNKFESNGLIEHGVPRSPSRIPVSIFGNHN